MTDVIDKLVGIAPGSRLDTVRRNRIQARDNAQLSYETLFTPATPGTVLIEERYAVAYFVSGLHRNDAAASFYREALGHHDRAGLLGAISAEIRRGETSGPYGSYPAGPLSAEDTSGLIYAPDPANRTVLGRLEAALMHAHLLVFRPRDSSSAALQALLNAGWSTDDIVTLSQLVAFLSFQIRVVTGLSALAAAATQSVAAE
ncbi:MAG: CMD domain protein [Caulobacteraceae bacterium]|nr:MAG: CMD domain protein [Caulobacteraceae bacterium]